MTSVVAEIKHEKDIDVDSKAYRCSKMFNNPDCYTREIYIVTKNNDQKNSMVVTGLDEADDESSKRLVKRIKTNPNEENLSETENDFIVLKKLYVSHHFMCVESPVWFKMFNSGSWKESRFNDIMSDGQDQIIYMQVENQLEAEGLYLLIESVHTSSLPSKILNDDDMFITYSLLADKYGMTDIIDLLIDELSEYSSESPRLSLNIAVIEHFQKSHSSLLEKMVKDAYENFLEYLTFVELNNENIKERAFGVLISLFSPLDIYLDDVRLMEIPSKYFMELIKDDRIVATNESVILWCCIKYIYYAQVKMNSTINQILNCPRFTLMSSISLLYFSTDFENTLLDKKFSISLHKDIYSCVEKRAKEVLFARCLPHRMKKIECANVRAKLSNTELRNLYTMDYNLSVPPDSVDIDENELKLVSINCSESYYRGGWKWMIKFQRHNDGGDLGNVGVYIIIEPIINQNSLKTTILAKVQLSIYNYNSASWNGLYKKTMNEFGSSGLGTRKFKSEENSRLKWSNLKKSGYMNENNIIRVQLIVDPESLEC